VQCWQEYIGPYFSENEYGTPVIVSGECYQEILQALFFWNSKGYTSTGMKLGFSKMVLQPILLETMELWRNFFPGHLISRSGDTPWPRLSPDLSALFSLGTHERNGVSNQAAIHSGTRE
jgi:hypothetical protein